MKRRTLLLAASATLVLTACGTNPVKPMSSNGGLSRGQLKKIILTALAERGWQVTDDANDHIDARYVKGPHVAAVQIMLNDKNYTIEMNEGATTLKEGNGKVHRKYNQWVQTLDADIQNLILKNRLK